MESAKLTLNIKKNIIQKAKTYARQKNKSLSELVEHYFFYLIESTELNEKEEELSPLIKDLAGSVKLGLVSDNHLNDIRFDYLKKNIYMNKIFLDNDVILDFLIDRGQFTQNAAKLFHLIINKKAIGFTSAIIILNTHYILAKITGKQAALKKTKAVANLLTILPVDANILIQAFDSKAKDLEDAVQYFCAILNNIPLIITRNTDDYPFKNISIVNPEEYLKIFNSASNEK